MNQMPKDPVMLLSYINTELRDNYESLEELCSSRDWSSDEIISALNAIDYHYDKSLNKFV